MKTEDVYLKLKHYLDTTFLDNYSGFDFDWEDWLEYLQDDVADLMKPQVVKDREKDARLQKVRELPAEAKKTQRK